jgi:hypothetical protein
VVVVVVGTTRFGEERVRCGAGILGAGEELGHDEGAWEDLVGRREWCASDPFNWPAMFLLLQWAITSAVKYCTSGVSNPPSIRYLPPFRTYTP